MIIWITALVLFALVGVSGHRLGAIRMGVALLGLAVGAVLARPLAPLIKPLLALAQVGHPLWDWALAPAVVFALVQVLFLVLALLVHRRISMHYKYNTDEVQMLRWERLNKRLGICVGLIMGCACLLLLAVLIYAAGYLTVQVAAADAGSEPAALHFLNEAREDLRDTGLEKAVAAVDPTPESYYAAADLIGLLYHNPVLQGRLADYPALVALGERPELQDLAKDTQFSEMMLSQPTLDILINHPKIQQIAKNPEILAQLTQLDLPDLLQFVQTGKSAKYDSEKILGRWQFDLISTFALESKKNTKLTATDLRKLKKDLEALEGATFIATPDKMVWFKGPDFSNSGSWTSAGAKYQLSIQSGGITVGKTSNQFDEVAVENGLLRLRSSKTDRVLVFERP